MYGSEAPTRILDEQRGGRHKVKQEKTRRGSIPRCRSETAGSLIEYLRPLMYQDKDQSQGKYGEKTGRLGTSTRKHLRQG